MNSKSVSKRVNDAIHAQWLLNERASRIRAIDRAVRQSETHGSTVCAPVVFVNPSARTDSVSANALIQLISQWGLRLGGVPVRNFTCKSGMSRCAVGVAQYGVNTPPPCADCWKITQQLHPNWRDLDTVTPAPLPTNVPANTLAELIASTHGQLPVGEMALPAARWALRRYNLPDDETTRSLMRHLIASGIHFYESFSRYVQHIQPRAVVVFNGISYPEVIARRVAHDHGIRAISYEFGHRRNSAYFTDGIAPEHKFTIPPTFTLNEQRTERLDDNLAQRLQGNFYMGGVKYYRGEVVPLPSALQARMAQAKQAVVIFPNVAFDTSQVFARKMFVDLFEWLAHTLEHAPRHPDTLFIVRAHPDELRPNKLSQETIGDWLVSNGYLNQPNILFISPNDFTNSYDLVRETRFTLAYNSTIGLEAGLLGKASIVAAHTKYDIADVAYAPSTQADYHTLLETFLTQAEPPTPTAGAQDRARRYLYYLFFVNSLDYSPYIKDSLIGFTLNNIQASDLSPEHSDPTRVLLHGILQEQPFHYLNGATLLEAV